MADDPEVIKHQMEIQRESLAAKLETLEREVTGKVQDAKDAVETAREAVNETVANVKQTVNETVETVRESFQSSVEGVKESIHSSVEGVKETFDIPLQTRRHPLAMFGMAVGVGYVSGLILNRINCEPRTAPRNWPEVPREQRMGSYQTGARGSTTAAPMVETPRRPDTAGIAPPQLQPTWTSQVMETVAPELQKLKGVAIGTVMGVVRDLVTQRTPEPMRPQVTEVINGLTQKLGGDLVEGNVLEQLMPQRGEPHHNAGNGFPRTTERSHI